MQEEEKEEEEEEVTNKDLFIQKTSLLELLQE
jgi:hypothetical protein